VQTTRDLTIAGYVTQILCDSSTAVRSLTRKGFEVRDDIGAGSNCASQTVPALDRILSLVIQKLICLLFRLCRGRLGMQMFVEELFHRFVEIEFVFFVMKTVPFVLLDHIFHIDTALLQSIYDLI